jgi:hypothetical protein
MLGASCCVVLLTCCCTLRTTGTESIKRARALLEKPESKLTDKERSHKKLVDGTGGMLLQPLQSLDVHSSFCSVLSTLVATAVC